MSAIELACARLCVCACEMANCLVAVDKQPKLAAPRRDVNDDESGGRTFIAAVALRLSVWLTSSSSPLVSIVRFVVLGRVL